VEWTYDPLEARNAHLNLNHLGAEVVEYIEDMYAGEMGSDLAQGIGTDRFIVRWRIASDRVAGILAGDPASDPAPFEGTPVLGLKAADEASPLPEVPRVRVEIPASIQDVKAMRPDEAPVWRQSTRRAIEHYFERGYRVTAYLREGDRRFYGLERL
jgi:predicted GNAT superfamily acetyltransferase